MDFLVCFRQFKNFFHKMIRMPVTGKYIQGLVLIDALQTSFVIIKQQLNMVQFHQKTAVANVCDLSHMLLPNTFQNGQQVFPHPLYRRDRKLFVRGMDVFHIRAKGYAVQLRLLFKEKAAFQTCMDGAYMRLFSKHFFERILHQITQFGVFAVLPCRIISENGTGAPQGTLPDRRFSH